MDTLLPPRPWYIRHRFPLLLGLIIGSLIVHWLDSYALNYGLIILLMTLLIKLITMPLTYKSFVASAKMRIAQQLPEVQALNDKYPIDAPD